MSTPTEDTGGSAVRLIFTDEHGTIRLIRQQRIDMAVTGFDAAPHVRPGDFVEVRDAAGASLTRVAIHSGLDTSLEVFPADPKGQIIRVQAPDRRRAFTVVVPARSAADSIAVVLVERPSGATTDIRADADVRADAAAQLVTAVPPVQVTELATFTLDC